MIYPDVPGFSPEEIAVLCDAYRENNFIDPKVSEKLGVKRGLRNPDGTGVLAGLTNICDVVGYDKKEDGTIVPIDGKLIYRGIELQTLVDEAINSDRFMFEEVVWLPVSEVLARLSPTQAQQLTKLASGEEDICIVPEEFRQLMEYLACLYGE